MATVIIPTPLRRFTNNNARVIISAEKVSDALAQLSTNFPDLRKHIINADGQLASFINIFVDNEDIRNIDQEQTEVKRNSIISIVPSIAGGVDFPSEDYGT